MRSKNFEKQDKHERKGNKTMACVTTEEKAKLARKMINKIKHYVANEYKPRK